MYQRFILLFLIITHGYLACADVPIFCIEGNTGAGKTTLINELCKRNPHFVLVKEPVDCIQNHAGENLLKSYFDNLSRWSFTCSVAFHLYHIEVLQKAMAVSPGSIYITDRSIFGMMHSFVALDSSAGFMNASELSLYKKLFSLTAPLLPIPKGFIYVRTNPEVAYQRICSRAREEEMAIPEQYWIDLHETYENMLIHGKQELDLIKDVPVLILDANVDITTSATALNELVNTIEDFINGILNGTDA